MSSFHPGCYLPNFAVVLPAMDLQRPAPSLPHTNPVLTNQRSTVRTKATASFSLKIPSSASPTGNPVDGTEASGSHTGASWILLSPKKCQYGPLIPLNTVAPLSVIWHWQFPRRNVVDGVAHGHPGLSVGGQQDLGCQRFVGHAIPDFVHVISARNASSSFLCRNTEKGRSRAE